MDEFRVPAYGSRGDDWLSLDYERGRRLMALPEGLISEAEGLWRPMLDLFGNNQLFGWVFLSRFKNPSIEITINRDRFYENDAFLNLKKFVRLGIDWATVRYSGWKEEEKKERAEVKELRPDEVLKKVRETVEEASKQLGDERTGQIIRSLESVQAAFQRQIEKQIDEISMLRVLASTGTMIFIFDHEIQLLISDLADIITELRSLIPILPADQKKKFTDHLSRLEDWKEKADQQILHLGRMLGSEARRQPREFALKPIVDQMALPFRRFMDGEDINFINDVQPDIRTPPMFEAELHAILLNLMTNSLKAVRGQPKRQICVKTKIKEKKLIIHFLDSGRGLPIERREVVFRPFESDSEPDLLLGHGTGLGLKIVRDIIRDYGGDAQFIDAPVPWKTCLEVILPVED